MQLNRILISGYRSFRHAQLDGSGGQTLDLAPLTLVIGKNNVGKSNVLALARQVLFMLGATANELFSPRPSSSIAPEQGLSADILKDLLFQNNLAHPLNLEADVTLEALPGEHRLVLELRRTGNILAQPDDQGRPPLRIEGTLDGQAFINRTEDPSELFSAIPESRVWHREARALLDGSIYLGPARVPLATHYHRMEKHRIISLRPAEVGLIHRLEQEDRLCKAASGWLKENFEGMSLSAPVALDQFSLKVGPTQMNASGVGQGIHQVLPVVTLCLWRQQEPPASPMLDLIEQPELHLHDAAHAPLGDLLVNTIKRGDTRLLVETHSEGLLLRVQRRIADGTIRPDQVALIYVDQQDEGTRLRRIEYSPNGELNWWPKDIFLERFEEVKQIRRAQQQRTPHT